jgi:hypothetical protein
MAGLYPDDQTISLFGKEVRWPGLDLSAHKFTNGSFSDPLEGPSFIPAETVNLILDNLENLITGMGQTPDNHDPGQLFKAVAGFHFPVGTMLSVLPDEPSPVERGWPGEWEIWSHRPVLYGVSEDPPPGFADYYTLAGNSIPAGNTPVVCYHQAGNDWRLYQFIAQAAAYAVPPELDLVKWTYLTPDAIDERRKCGNALTDDDYEIGDTVTSGSHAGKYVTEIIVPGGKFTGIEGGDRPAFISGGVQQDRIRNITGSFASTTGPGTGYEGAFYGGTGIAMQLPSNAASSTRRAFLDPSLVVTTGPDVAGANFSKRLWRRVS